MSQHVWCAYAWVRRFTGLCVGLIWVCLQPAMAAISVEGSLDRHFVASPGQVIQGQIDIHNALDAPAWVRVEVTDYQVDASGRASYPRAPSHERSLAHYVQLMRPEQTLGPKASGRIEFEVRLPTLTDRPELAGAYWAVVMVKQQAIETSQDGSTLDQWMIQERFQTAVRITTEIKEHGALKGALTSPVVTLRPKPMFAVTLANSAQRLIDVQLVGELFNAEGQSLGRTALGRLQVYPGHQRRLEWAIHELLPNINDWTRGDYQAIVMAVPEARMLRPDPFGARFELRWDTSSRPRSVDQLDRSLGDD